ncbi:unnamed protein product [Dibothriocephalus latus]|uniref:Uncharacterized protein n=1 Tax=Dibothriocephalus latus TaxID=60516 RepID=A0A3P7RNM4_DIBLA|nr:unnamed protein product [Dibothriocephalus latus]
MGPYPQDIQLRQVLAGHRAAVNVVDFDEKFIVSASGDRTIKFPQMLLSDWQELTSMSELGRTTYCSLSCLVVSGIHARSPLYC